MKLGFCHVELECKKEEGLAAISTARTNEMKKCSFKSV